MPPPSLHAEGWRQGSLIREPMDVHFLDLVDGVIVDRVERLELWLLATQDCDLAQTHCKNTTRQLELRPVLLQTSNDRLDGLRSRSICVREGLVLRAESQKLTLTPRALNTLKDKRENSLDEERRVQIKAWLGLRYDRPAIPEPFVPLAEHLKLRFIDEMPDTFIGVVRDVWVYFENDRDVRLWVILVAARKDRADEVRDWIDDVIAECNDNGIIVRERQVEGPDRTPLSILQTYYGLGIAELSNQESGDSN